jgi:hypothetical protein
MTGVSRLIVFALAIAAVLLAGWSVPMPKGERMPAPRNMVVVRPDDR